MYEIAIHFNMLSTSTMYFFSMFRMPLCIVTQQHQSVSLFIRLRVKAKKKVTQEEVKCAKNLYV